MMTEKEFDLKLQHIQEQGQARHESANAWIDQEMARLFNTCDWTQEKIAGRMGKTQPWVTYRLIFGRFLDFITTVINLETLAGLTERRFRGYWSKTKGTERERFKQVANILEHGIPQGFDAIRNKTGVKKAVIDVLDDRKWYTSQQILASVEEVCLGVTATQIADAIKQIKRTPPTGRSLESKNIGNKSQYCLTDRDDSDPLTPAKVLFEQAEPIIDELESLSRRHRSDITMEMFRSIAVRLRRLFEEILLEVTT